MSPAATPSPTNGNTPHPSILDGDAHLNRWADPLLGGRRHHHKGSVQLPKRSESNTRLKKSNAHTLLYSGCTSVIFDLGDVLFTWSSSSPDSPLSPKTLKQVLRSSKWFEYEKGNMTEDEAYIQIAHEFNLVASDVGDAFRAARDSLKCNPVLLDLIREIKGSGRQVFAMSNISAPDWDVLSTKADPSQWALFDQVFTSAASHERKPNVGFYHHVLSKTGVDPTRTVFVDDKLENVLTARSFGMHGILFDEVTNVVRQLKNICGDPVQRAKFFLTANKKRLISVTSNGIPLRENFAQLLILEATGDRSLVDYVEHPRLFNFFQGAGMLTTEQFPNDLDTTSIGLTVSTNIDPETKHIAMDEMLSFRNEDDIVQVYFDHSRPRIDPVVCVNVLTLFYRNGRGRELESTLEWVYFCLLHGAYSDGTLYYATAETFLFFVSRLMQSSSRVRQRFEPVFKERIIERFGVEGDSLALAMRVLAAAGVGMVDRTDFDKLLSMQEEDGSWTKGWFYKYGSSGVLIGNVGFTTALAIRAIDAVENLSRGDDARMRIASGGRATYPSAG